MGFSLMGGGKVRIVMVGFHRPRVVGGVFQTMVPLPP